MVGGRKLVRDLWASRGRTVLMVLAVASALSGLGMVLTAYGVLTREARRNYMDTRPASATLHLDEVSEELVKATRLRPEVAAADRRRMILSRWRSDAGDEWGRALLFVVDDFERMPLAALGFERGAQVPALGTVLVERSALRVTRLDVGDSLWLRVPGGTPRKVTISGVVHEPALAPAVTEQSGYFYATVETLAWLGGEPEFDELRVLVAEHDDDQQAIEATAQELASWVEGRGEHVQNIGVPRPHWHPHETQLRAVLTLLGAFALLMVVLGGVLTASLMTTLMARQVREIGVMKTVGATSGRIAALYGAMLGAIATAAVLVSLGPGVAAGLSFSVAIADLLNFDLASFAVPWWVFAVQAAAGLSLPLLTAAPALWRGSRVTVREAITDYGVTVTDYGRRPLDRLLVRLGRRRRVLIFSLRNTLRRRGRFALTVALLGAAGGMFIGALSISQGWRDTVAKVYRTRHYELELRLSEPAPAAELVAAIESLPEVERAEAWGMARTALARPGLVDVAHTYPDGGHGSFWVLAPPGDSALVDFSVLRGRWLRPGDTDAVVLNQMAVAELGLAGEPVGQELELTLSGRPTRWRIAGVVEEIGAPAVAYVTGATFADVVGTAGTTSMLRVATATGRDPQRTRTAVRAVEAALEDQGAEVSMTLPLEVLRNAMGEHVELLIQALLTLAVLMAVVGSLGLGSTMATSVVERTRELGMLQAIGATRAQVRRTVLLEGLLAGLASLPAALLIALPLALVVGNLIGQLSFHVDLPLRMSWSGAGMWAAGTLVLSLLASAVPAQRAARLTVHEALAYV